MTVHPLVLLSAADHYHRVARGTRKRAVGVLLGSVARGRVDATNSFAVPFEEYNKNPVSSQFETYCYRILYMMSITNRTILFFPLDITKQGGFLLGPQLP